MEYTYGSLNDNYFYYISAVLIATLYY